MICSKIKFMNSGDFLYLTKMASRRCDSSNIRNSMAEGQNAVDVRLKRFAFTLKHHVSRNALKSKISGSVR